MDGQDKLDVGGADRLVEQLVDGGLPLQLGCLFRTHHSRIGDVQARRIPRHASRGTLLAGWHKLVCEAAVHATVRAHSHVCTLGWQQHGCREHLPVARDLHGG